MPGPELNVEHAEPVAVAAGGLVAAPGLPPPVDTAMPDAPIAPPTLPAEVPAAPTVAGSPAGPGDDFQGTLSAAELVLKPGGIDKIRGYIGKP